MVAKLNRSLSEALELLLNREHLLKREHILNRGIKGGVRLSTCQDNAVEFVSKGASQDKTWCAV